jgi:OmcA/MtrC family decaheme c-type cytochrome
VPVDSAEKINIAVTGIAVPAGGGAPVVELRLTNDLVQGLTGLPAGDIRFTLAQLSPEAPGSGESSEWQSYIARSSNGVPNAQADAERGSAGTFVDNGDGTYQYTFAMALPDYPAGPAYDENSSHRLGIEIRGQAPISTNGIIDFVPTVGGPAAGMLTRDIVDTDTCAACHDAFDFHGGPRVDVPYCVTCHNPYSTDEDTGNSVDMKVLIHKIHYGVNLANGYTIIGHGGSVHDYSTVVFPQDVRNCQTCHEESDPNTPDASNWQEIPNRAACGTCHDDIDWENGGHNGVSFFDDTACLSCHGPNATAAGPEVRIANAHALPLQEISKQFEFNIVDVASMTVGQTPTVDFSVTDPTNGDAPYDLLADPEFTTCAGGASRVAVGIAWNTDDYTNTGSGMNPAQPISMNPLACFGNPPAADLGGGVYRVTSPIPLPATATGTAAVTIDGHPAVDVDGTIERVPVTNVVEYVGIGGGAASDRRLVVDIQKCDDCHKQLSLHGNNRTDNPQVCVTCHNPNATDANRRGVGGSACDTQLGADDAPVDMKYMIHAIHASGDVGVPFEVCGFGNSAHVFDFVYPGKLNNCEGCHVVGDDTFYPVDPGKVLGTTVDVGADVTSPVDDTAISPNTAVCSTCHVTQLAADHMQQNGGDFAAGKAADSALISSGVETCAVCHGPGRTSDVKEVHGVGKFQFN